jgi:hypothetical protein
MPSSYQIKLALEKIIAKLDVIDAKVSMAPQIQVEVSSRFLPTLIALKKLGSQATATQVSQVTGRARANESDNLNQLHRMGLLMKEKDGRKKLFRLRDEHAQR